MDHELAFTQAVNAWKRRTGRAFPKWSELLGMLRDLGWQEPKPVAAALPPQTITHMIWPEPACPLQHVTVPSDHYTAHVLAD